MEIKRAYVVSLRWIQLATNESIHIADNLKILKILNDAKLCVTFFENLSEEMWENPSNGFLLQILFNPWLVKSKSSEFCKALTGICIIKIFQRVEWVFMDTLWL